LRPKNLIAVKDFCSVLTDKVHNPVEKIGKFVFSAIEETHLTPIVQRQNKVVVGHEDVYNIFEIDCFVVLGIDDEFHIVHILGLHYIILQIVCHYPAKEKK
jgi:hypothetical protein